MKWCRKALLNCSKLSMDEFGSFVNHSLAAAFRVVGNERHSISSGGCWRPNVVLKVLRWSWGSLRPSNGSSWGRRNLEGIGHSRIAVVKGESWPSPSYPHSDLFSLSGRSSAHPFLSLLLVATLNSVHRGWQVFNEHSSYDSLLLHPGYPWTPTEPVKLAKAVTSSPDFAWWVPR